MARLRYKVKLRNRVCHNIQNELYNALFKTAEALRTDVVHEQVMPFDTGHLQNETTYVKRISNKQVRLVSTAMYAKKVYTHDEINFSTRTNRRAQAHWLEPYISGHSKDFCKDTYVELVRKILDRRNPT